jgi:hypothetical protein
MANFRIRWRGIFKGLSQDGGLVVFSETAAPLPLIKTYRKSLIWAGSISGPSQHNLEPGFFQIILKHL